jgi:glutaredoxin
MALEVFVVPNCGRCRYLKDLLVQAGLAYVEVDASAGLGPLRRLRRLTGADRVPILVSGERWWPALTAEEARTAVAELKAGVEG